MLFYFPRFLFPFLLHFIKAAICENCACALCGYSMSLTADIVRFDPLPFCFSINVPCWQHNANWNQRDTPSTQWHAFNVVQHWTTADTVTGRAAFDIMISHLEGASLHSSLCYCLLFLLLLPMLLLGMNRNISIFTLIHHTLLFSLQSYNELLCSFLSHGWYNGRYYGHDI